jgi:uncharacterized protein YcgI (DUF1989 family)
MDDAPASDAIVSDEIVPAGRPSGHRVRRGEILRLF